MERSNLTIRRWLRLRLRRVAGVDAAYLMLQTASSKHEAYAIAREHGDVDRGALLAIEDAAEQYGIVLDIRVWAHQGRLPPGEMFPARCLLFTR